ncbi:MAG: BREX-1 system adenine-specific DNA-methyltransferase PglX [Flavobacteriaceae bacterium]|nr:BREX-1 system adenine-specific DNA-methyltransferase PglX [Flavobacteriaceae bacterium]
MPLFQSSVLQKYVNALDTAVVDAAYERFTAHFHDAGIQENIRNAKEEQYQGEFLIDLFVRVLGYIKNPTPHFNLTTELKNVKDSKKADGAILTPALSKGEGEGQVLAVIELKGTAVTDLGKIEVQAFGYKNNQPGCVFVITSNFEKLRFYIDNAVDFEEFNLFAMSRERFDVLWLCLSADSLLRLLPKQLKDESLSREEVVTKELYKDYALFRTEVFRDIVAGNPQVDKLTLFKVTQKLLDRFLFIFFAEDRLLLPPNSIRAIVQQWEDLRDKYDEYQPLYERFKKYFGYMNTGHKGQKHEIFAYNGGLFLPDPILDSIVIDDALLHKHTFKLSNYDFVSEVSVNILGHIFEHSLNEIEEIQAELEGQTVDKGTSKRKKDGVFYTPKYITKYIVDNTVGKLCEEQKTALGIDDADYDRGRKGRQKDTIKKLEKNLEDYRNWLLQITICDPACGSGAFLNQALEFLIAEHAYVDELYAKLYGDAMYLYEVQNSILENNLFGVDINNESVEIAKLSLWLRTAQKGRKLTSLNNNIKCGNSLIDDPAVAGDKAFDWEKEFPQVFVNGGFDVVIGNPPYGAKIDSQQTKHISNKFNASLSGEIDTYIIFYFSSISILKKNGILGFITPDTWLTISKASGLRNYLLNNVEIIDVYDRYKPFVDAKDTRCHTIILRNQKSTSSINVTVVNSKSEVIKSFELPLSELKLNQEWNVYTSNEEREIFNKMKNNSVKLEDLFNLKYGLRTGNNSKYLTNDINESISGIKIARGSNIENYYFNWSPEYLITKEGLPDSYFDESLINSPKIIIQYVRTNSTNPKARWLESTIIEEDNFVPLNSTSFVYLKDNGYSLKYLLPLISSYLLNFYYKAHYTDVNVKPLYLAQLPIPIVDELKQQFFIEKADIMIKLNKELKSIVFSFNSLMQSKFTIEKLTNKLRSWHELDFKGFLKELKKAKVQLSLPEEAEWMGYFNEQKQKATALQQEIDRVDREIDGMVYGLYGLSEEEVAIVENS